MRGTIAPRWRAKANLLMLIADIPADFSSKDGVFAEGFDYGFSRH
jgi:hypothetical protein